MPLIRFPTVKGLVYTIDLSKIADRENPRTVEAPIHGYYSEDIVIDWGDGTSENLAKNGSGLNNGPQYPSHTYADGTGDKFTVVIRSVKGGVPVIYFNNTAYASNPERNVTYAVVSIDHYGAHCDAITTRNNVAKRCYNLKYIDTRICGETTMNNAPFMCAMSGIQQPIESFCLDFAIGIQDFGSVFIGCTGLTGAIPETFLNNCVSISGLAQIFSGCTRLTAPYVFWDAAGEIDTAKFPNLVKSRAAATYSGCTGMDLSQIPTHYGGTMTVS